MEFDIRDVREADLDTIFRLNESEVPNVGRIDFRQLQWFAENAAYFRVAAHADTVGAFLIGLRPGTSYASPNYRWFCDHYKDFAYIDRVAVAPLARRQRLASRLYEDFAVDVAGSVDLMTCEVNILPPNHTSLQFHRQLGFEQVGELASEGTAKVVALLAKSLP